MDITERKRADEALKESEARLKLFITHAPAALAVFDRDMRYLAVSRRWLSDYGLGDGNIIGRSHVEIFPEIPDRWKAVYDRGFAGEIVQADEDSFERADGSVQWLRWEVRPWPAADGTVGGIVLFTEDISERKHAEQALRQVHAELEERVVERTVQLEAANKELEAFSYSVSHDLRAPLRAIAGFSKILLKSYAEVLPAKAQDYLQDVHRNTLHMGHLVDDLLAFSRLSRQPVKKVTVVTGEIVRQCLNDLRGDHVGRQVDIRIGDLPPCLADPALLKQVWFNLLANALKYTNKREATIIEIGSRVGDDSGKRTYFVKDNGVGFDMEYAHKLFGVFQRLHRSEDYEGTGVGLAIVQRIIHRHGGRIWAEAEPDRGATFSFSLEEGKTLHE
jgi:PAS domain S-box-containing protein